jgi:hypothetical protein
MISVPKLALKRKFLITMPVRALIPRNHGVKPGKQIWDLTRIPG